jgi:4-hydroxy-tetrahydrodipicolinate synthase
VESSELRGVIAAAATPITPQLEPDLERFVALCRFLLESGCDGLNICGTTGEATSFTLRQRMAIMSIAAASLPLDRLMVGTGAASLGDAVALTRHAAELGFAGALLLPPFYYKGVAEDGVFRYVERIVEATTDAPVDLYLYNFPALSGVDYGVSLVARLCETFRSRIAGLKDSSGDLAYAAQVAAVSPKLLVFPSNEAVLLRARAGEFAGCISASANVNASYCAKAFREGDGAASATASQIRALLSRKPLIASVKAALAWRMHDPAFESVMPPLSPLPAAERDELVHALCPLLP